MASLSDWSLPTTLSPPLTGRDAVIDAVYRAVLGLDTNDVNLFKSAFTTDSAFIFNDNTTKGIETIVSELFDKIAKLDTTHFLTNLRVNIDGSEASLTASALAQHYRGGSGTDPKAERLMSGCLYMIDLVREEGEVEMWKIASWRMRMTWVEGEMAIVM